MSEYELPFHIQEEIMKRLPVIQFRSVSKAWKSLIDSSEFIAAHSLHSHMQQHHLLVSYQYVSEELDHFLISKSYTDDDTFPQQRSVPSASPPPPLSTLHIIRPIVIGSSHGLFCLYGIHLNFVSDVTLLWNLSIRKCIAVDVPAIANGFGFGVCPITNDPKIVSITQSSRGVPEASYKCEVMVYTLSSGRWRSLSGNLPTEQVRDLWSSVVTDGFIYWRAVLPTRNVITSFDVTNESFEVIDLPDTLAHHDLGDLYIRKLRESLAILQSHTNTCTIWMMEDGVQRSFTKLFTIETKYEIMGFRKSGVPILKVTDDEDDEDGEQLSKLVVYEPNSEHNNVLEMCTFDSFDVNSYTETLLLHG